MFEYTLLEVYVNEKGMIKEREVKSGFDTEREVRDYRKICEQLKPESKFLTVLHVKD